MKSNTGKNPNKKNSKTTPAKTEAEAAPVAARPAVPVPVPTRPPVNKAAASPPSAPPPVASKPAAPPPTAPSPVAPKTSAAVTVVKVPVTTPVSASPPAPAPKEATAVPAAPAAIAETPNPATAPHSVKVTFTLLDPVATQVALAGEFNSWSPESLPLKRGGEGHWQTTLTLKPGKYQYKFVVDGAWVADPKATETQSNEFGTLNSVVEVKA